VNAEDGEASSRLRASLPGPEASNEAKGSRMASGGLLHSASMVEEVDVDGLGGVGHRHGRA
jgi:hypothetical protein